MDLGKYLQQLLLENETVIIPGFGAFVSNYKPAEIDKESNELKPPSKEISFNQHIRNNDGLLVGCVAEGEVISHFDALKEIEKERENLLYELDKKGKVVLGDIGELILDDNNEIHLISADSGNLLLDSFGLESISLEESQVQPEEDPEEPAITAVPPAEEAQGEEEAKEEEIVENEDQPEEESEPEESIDEEKTVAVADTVVQEEEPKKKKRGWIWLLLVLAPLLVVAAYIINQNKNFFNTPEEPVQKPVVENKPDVIPADTTKLDTIIKAPADSISIDSTIIANKQDSVQTPEEPVAQGRFILVGGSFKAEENAETYYNQLKEQGHNPFHLGKKGSFFIVGIGRYKTEAEAAYAKRDFNTKNPDSGVWVYEEK